MKKEKITNALDRITEFAVYFTVFVVPFSKSALEICITIAFVSWVAKKILCGDLKLIKTPLNTLLFLFVAANLLSFVNAEFRILFARAMLTKCLKFVLLYFIVVETINCETRLKNLLKMAFVSAVVVMLDSFVQYYILHFDPLRAYRAFKYAPATDLRIGAIGFKGYPTGPFPFPNDLAAWLLVILMPVVALFLWGVKKTKEKILLGLFAAPFLYLFFLTNVRSAWFSALASSFSITFIHARRAFFILAVIIVIAALVVPLFLSKDKFDDIAGFSSMGDRFYMWRVGWEVFMEHPIIGNGLNMFFGKFKEHRTDEFQGQRGSYAHNGFLQIAAEIGLVGLIIFLFLIITVFARIYTFVNNNKNDFAKALAVGLAGGLLAFLAHSFFDTNLQSLPLVTFFWVNVAVIMALEKIYAKEV